ncbi:hypothetical protein ACWD4P_24220 [Kitasatospora sp. NPDC002543]
MDSTTHPPKVSRLHYEVIDWLGDSIVQTFPCHLVLRGVARRFAAEGFTGFRTGEATVSASEDFHELNPGGEVPDLVWLLVDGEPGVADLGLTDRARLVVSERVLDVLKSGTLDAGTFSPWPGRSPVTASPQVGAGVDTSGRPREDMARTRTICH